MERYVGLDVHSKTCVYVIQDQSGATLGEGSVPTSLEGLLLLRARYDLPPGTRVALESGTTAFFVARRLARLGLVPLVVDAGEVRLKASRPNQKSDRRDALELCEGLRRGVYRTIVHVPPEPIIRLRETLARRRHFVRIKTMQVNAVKHLLRAAGLASFSRNLNSAAGWERLMGALSSDSTLQAFAERHRSLWRCSHEQVGALEASLHEQRELWNDDVIRLQTAPGVGPIVALTVIAVFSDVARFPSAKHAASYAGLVASTFQSGESDRHGHITKRGSSELRAMLCEAAHHARRATHPLHPYYRQLCSRRGYKMAIVAIANRLCRILWAMLRHRVPFDVSKLNIEVGPFEKTSTQLYRRRRAALIPA